METQKTALITDREKLSILCKAFEQVLIGGNHIASNLIGELGAGKENFPAYGTPFSTVQEILARRFPDTWIGKYEQWCAWNACMLARDMVEAKLGEDFWKEFL